MIGTIKVDELNMGTKAPELEVMEIGDLSEEKFKGIFKITYQGDAYIVIRATLQINPLVVPETPITLSVGSGVIAADQPLLIPVKLRISDLKLSGIAALGFSNKGITFCFKNDPLEDINVSSTFDRIQAIKKLIERIIKTQISAFLLEDVPELIHNFSKSNKQSTPNNTSHSRSYSGEIYNEPSSLDYNYGNSIYGDDADNFGSSQTLVDEENDIMGWRRKWIGNDFNDPNVTFDNRIILYRGLKCLKSVNANRGILRLLNPSLNKYVCQSIHIDSWLITPPFSPIPLYIPKASYHSYTKDKHFSIVDYLRRTAITRTTNYKHQRDNSFDNLDINEVENPFRRLQQTSESPIKQYYSSPTLSSPHAISNSNDDLSNDHHHSYNYTHTYHRGQRKSKSLRKFKSNSSTLTQSSSSAISDLENDTLFNSPLGYGNDEENIKLIPQNNRGHVRGYSNQTNSSEGTSTGISNNNGAISKDNVFLSLLNNNNNNNTMTGSSVNIYTRNNVNGKVSSTNSNSGYISDGESTVCEEFPSEIVIEPSNNSMAAQLTNLMNSNQTISPYTRTLEHFAYRSFPHSKSNYKRRNNRQRHRLKIHVDGLMGSSSTSSMTPTNQDVKSQTS